MRLSCLQENLKRGLGIVGRGRRLQGAPCPSPKMCCCPRTVPCSSSPPPTWKLASPLGLGAMVEEEGSITVPARLLSDFVDSLPAERIDLNVTQRPKAVELSCARSQATINGTDAEEFPPIPTVEEGLAAKLDVRKLRTAIAPSGLRRSHRRVASCSHWREAGDGRG